jgi:hypothetical protein
MEILMKLNQNMVRDKAHKEEVLLLDACIEKAK